MVRRHRIEDICTGIISALNATQSGSPCRTLTKTLRKNERLGDNTVLSIPTKPDDVLQIVSGFQSVQM